MKPGYKRPFTQFIKKAHKPLQLAIEDVVEMLCVAPEMGEAKVGDLAGVWVYKFRFNRQEYLVAYRPPPGELLCQRAGVELLFVDFYQVGSRENFYDELKQYLKSEEGVKP